MKDYSRHEHTYTKSQAINRNSLLRNRYGITLDEYFELSENQNHRCAICNCAEDAVSRNSAKRVLSVDHCHQTGRIRGLLCNACNRAIGYMKDNPSLLRNAANYLEGDF